MNYEIYFRKVLKNNSEDFDSLSDTKLYKAHATNVVILDFC